MFIGNYLKLIFCFSCKSTLLNKIFILNERWSYVSSKGFSRPVYFTTIGKSLCVTGERCVWKLDQNLNILIQFNASSGSTPGYVGIYFNSSNDLIYVAPRSLNVIHVFNLNLTLNHTFSTSMIISIYN